MDEVDHEQAPSSEPIKKLSPNIVPKNRMTRMARRGNSTGPEVASSRMYAHTPPDCSLHPEMERLSFVIGEKEN